MFIFLLLIKSKGLFTVFSFINTNPLSLNKVYSSFKNKTIPLLRTHIILLFFNAFIYIYIFFDNSFILDYNLLNLFFPIEINETAIYLFFQNLLFILKLFLFFLIFYHHFL